MYIKNMSLASGYDTLDVITEMDACPTNDIGRMLDYVNQMFPQDTRWVYSDGTWVVTLKE